MYIYLHGVCKCLHCYNLKHYVIDVHDPSEIGLKVHRMRDWNHFKIQLLTILSLTMQFIRRLQHHREQSDEDGRWYLQPQRNYAEQDPTGELACFVWRVISPDSAPICSHIWKSHMEVTYVKCCDITIFVYSSSTAFISQYSLLGDIWSVT